MNLTGNTHKTFDSVLAYAEILLQNKTYDDVGENPRLWVVA